MHKELQCQQGYDEIDLVEIVRILLRSWKIIVAIFIISVLLVGSITHFWIPKKYKSHTLFSLQAEGNYGSSFGKADMVKDIIHTNYFLGSVLDKHGLGTTQAEIAQLRSAITITKTPVGNIRLELIWGDPQQAYELLSSVFDSYKDEVAGRLQLYTGNKMEVAEKQFAYSKAVFEQVNSELAAFQGKKGVVFPPDQLAISDQYYLDFKGKLGVSPEDLLEYENLVAQHAAAKANYIKAFKILEDTRRLVESEQKYLFVVIEPPVFPERKHSPSTMKNTAVAGALALFAGVMLAFLRDYIRKYKEREQSGALNR